MCKIKKINEIFAEKGVDPFVKSSAAVMAEELVRLDSWFRLSCIFAGLRREFSLKLNYFTALFISVFPKADAAGVLKVFPEFSY